MFFIFVFFYLILIFWSIYMHCGGEPKHSEKTHTDMGRDIYLTSVLRLWELVWESSCLGLEVASSRGRVQVLWKTEGLLHPVDLVLEFFPSEWEPIERNKNLRSGIRYEDVYFRYKTNDEDLRLTESLHFLFNCWISTTRTIPEKNVLAHCYPCHSVSKLNLLVWQKCLHAGSIINGWCFEFWMNSNINISVCVSHFDLCHPLAL